jgi:hypothetical protein
MCGRKKKFGLNMMGTVDFLGRFLDVQIRHPGSTSDYLAFATSDLKALLEKPGFLAPGLVIFGDNAYPNTEYMVTPFKGTRGETFDDFNFYHSQLRIQVECAFGKLVHRFGILRRPIPTTMGLTKTSALVSALCRLHNFCTESSSGAPESSPVPEPLEQDNAYAAIWSGIELQETEANTHEPTALLHGGEHFNDINRNIRRQLQRQYERGGGEAGNGRSVLPQQRLLHALVVNQGLRRPNPKNW